MGGTPTQVDLPTGFRDLPSGSVRIFGTQHPHMLLFSWSSASRPVTGIRLFDDRVLGCWAAHRTDCGRWMSGYRMFDPSRCPLLSTIKEKMSTGTDKSIVEYYQVCARYYMSLQTLFGIVCIMHTISNVQESMDTMDNDMDGSLASY